MNEINTKKNFISNFHLFFKDNLKKIFYIIAIILIIIISYQIYNYLNNKRLLNLSLKYYETKNIISEDEFLYKMNLISEENNFYGHMAALEKINIQIKKNKFNDAYQAYIDLLNNDDLDSMYLTLISIHASYNLFGNVNDELIITILSYADESLTSFKGYKLEILFLLSLNQANHEETNTLYEQIIADDKISLQIKERVKKIYEYKKYN